MKIHFQFFKIQDDVIFVFFYNRKNRSFFFQSTDALHFNLHDQLPLLRDAPKVSTVFPSQIRNELEYSCTIFQVNAVKFNKLLLSNHNILFNISSKKPYIMPKVQIMCPCFLSSILDFLTREALHSSGRVSFPGLHLPILYKLCDDQHCIYKPMSKTQHSAYQSPTKQPISNC